MKGEQTMKKMLSNVKSSVHNFTTFAEINLERFSNDKNSTF